MTCLVTPSQAPNCWSCSALLCCSLTHKHEACKWDTPPTSQRWGVNCRPQQSYGGTLRVVEKAQGKPRASGKQGGSQRQLALEQCKKGFLTMVSRECLGR